MFSERNQLWDGTLRQFVQTMGRTQKNRFWHISVNGNKIQTSWGVLGGAIQTAIEETNGVNIGKSNEKTPAQYALEFAREKCRKRFLEGYREIDSNGELIDQRVSGEIDFDNLPSSLCFYKPDNSMGSGILKKAEEKKVIYTRKRNGIMFVISKGTGKPKLYSRRMLRQHDDEIGGPFTWDDRFQHIVEEADYLMPPNSIILGELISDTGGRDNFKVVQSLIKSLTPQSRSDQNFMGKPKFYVWDIAFWNGEDLLSRTKVMSRYNLAHSLNFRSDIIQPIQICLFNGVDEAMSFLKKEGWEGFVVVDPDGIYGDKGFNFKGKPDRPGSYCAKLKPIFEDDFVVYWDPAKKLGEVSTKTRYNSGIKSVALFQYNTRKELVFISMCSSGMTEDMKTALASPLNFPQVWQINYTDRRYVSRGDETNALDFPRFVQVRTDKVPEECINEEL